MKFVFVLVLCFVFVSLTASQGYGRSRKPKKPTFHPKPDVKKPMVKKPAFDAGWSVDNPIAALSGGGMDIMPPEIARILGSTVHGQPLVGGMNGMPVHGGSGLSPDGLRNDWGSNPNDPLPDAVSSWQSPMGNAAYPIDYAGEELIFDPNANRWVPKHQQAKETQYFMAEKSNIMPGVGPMGIQSPLQAEHNIVKEAQHVAHKTVNGMSPVMEPAFGQVIGPLNNPVAHHTEKKIVGQQMQHVAQKQTHNIVKSSGVLSAGKPSYLQGKGPVNVGVIGQVDPAIISHNIGKATLGADAMMGHNIAKSSGPVSGVGFMNPGGHAAGKMGAAMAQSQFVHQSANIEHQVAKSSLGGVPMGGQMGVPLGSPMGNPLGGAIIGSPMGGAIGGPIDGRFGNVQTDPVHNVHKVSNSGIIAAGHDPLASAIGHGFAKDVIGEAAHAVEMGSQGGVSAGDPLAIAATHGLANEAAHVAGKVLNVAAQANPINPNGPIGVGKNIFGGGMHPKPTNQKPPKKIPTGYGRRRF